MLLLFGFQSAPLTEARGDATKPTRPSRRLSFNPLPSPKQGETCAPRWELRRSGSFNPLPSPKQGETSSRFAIATSNVVSIRSPHRSKGRPGDGHPPHA